MIYVRDDDVLVNSSAYTDKRKTPLERFKQIHRWICDTPKLLHVPTLVVEPLMSHPEAVEFICSETEAGRMKPQIHGYEHIDYDQLSSNQVTEHLIKCKNFFWDQFGLVPTKWYTPWGANSSRLQFVASHRRVHPIEQVKQGVLLDLCDRAVALFLVQNKVDICHRFADRMNRRIHPSLIELHVAHRTRANTKERAEISALVALSGVADPCGNAIKDAHVLIKKREARLLLCAVSKPLGCSVREVFSCLLNKEYHKFGLIAGWG